MSFKKSLEESDKSFSSFEVNKEFKFTDVDSGSGVFAVPIIKGTNSNVHNFSTDTATQKTISGSIFYKTPNYHMINNLYYKDIPRSVSLDSLPIGKLMPSTITSFCKQCDTYQDCVSMLSQ